MDFDEFLSTLSADQRWKAFFINFGYAWNSGHFVDPTEMARILIDWIEECSSGLARASDVEADEARERLAARLRRAHRLWGIRVTWDQATISAVSSHAETCFGRSSDYSTLTS